MAHGVDYNILIKRRRFRTSCRFCNDAALFMISSCWLSGLRENRKTRRTQQDAARPPQNAAKRRRPDEKCRRNTF